MNKEEIKEHLVRIEELSDVASRVWRGYSDEAKDVTNRIVNGIYYRCAQYAHEIKDYMDIVKEIDDSPCLIKMLNKLTEDYEYGKSHDKCKSECKHN